MTARELDLLAAFEQVFGPQPTNRPRTYDPASDLDEDTLRRSFGGLSSTARREQRQPVQVRVDEYGWGNDGRYYPSRDGAA